MDAVLQIDVGNSRLKWRRLRTDGTVAARGSVQSQAVPDCSELLAAGVTQGVRIGSVAGAAADRALQAALHAAGAEDVRFARAGSRCGRLRAGYREPERMGVDRWLALAAAAHRVSGALLVVDAGSALTLDLVAEDGRHQGGWILPGLQMMRRALLAGTAGVRFELADEDAPGPGRDTAEAVSRGTLLMARDFVATRWMRFREEAPGATLFLTGGDAAALQADLPGTVRVAPDLVLDGLSRVFDHAR